jgi:hypothetical protein
VLRLINEQTAMLQALVSVLASHGLIDPNEVKAKHWEMLHDPQRALALYETFRQYLEELQK